MVTPGAIGARVMAVDGFGNVQLNVEAEHLAAAGIAGAVKVGEHHLPFVRIFADLPEHELGAIVDSQGFIALVVNKGSAAQALSLRNGDTVDPGARRRRRRRTRARGSAAAPAAGRLGRGDRRETRGERRAAHRAGERRRRFVERELHDRRPHEQDGEDDHGDEGPPAHRPAG